MKRSIVATIAGCALWSTACDPPKPRVQTDSRQSAASAQPAQRPVAAAPNEGVMLADGTTVSSGCDLQGSSPAPAYPIDGKLTGVRDGLVTLKDTAGREVALKTSQSTCVLVGARESSTTGIEQGADVRAYYTVEEGVRTARILRAEPGPSNGTP
jgi:hypothetical protein